MKTANEILRAKFPAPTNEAERNDDANIIVLMEEYLNEYKASQQQVFSESEIEDAAKEESLKWIEDHTSVLADCNSFEDGFITAFLWMRDNNISFLPTPKVEDNKTRIEIFADWCTYAKKHNMDMKDASLYDLYLVSISDKVEDNKSYSEEEINELALKIHPKQEFNNFGDNNMDNRKAFINGYKLALKIKL